MHSLWVVVVGAWLSCAAQVESKQDKVPAGDVSLGETFHIGWSVDIQAKTIKFTVSTVVDVKTGWILVGFMPRKNHSKPQQLEDTRGDVFVLWSAYRQKTQWKIANCNTMEKKGSLKKDHKHKTHLYHLENPVSFDNKTQTVKAIVIRKLHIASSNKGDLPIDYKKTEPVYFFGSYGMHSSAKNRKWKDFIKDTGMDNFDDNFKSELVKDMFATEHPTNKKENLGKFAATIAKKHWVGILVGSAACLTVVITCTVYCCTRNRSGDEFKKKKVTVSFYKEDDYDDEAKVSFLQSTEEA